MIAHAHRYQAGAHSNLGNPGWVHSPLARLGSFAAISMGSDHHGRRPVGMRAFGYQWRQMSSDRFGR